MRGGVLLGRLLGRGQLLLASARSCSISAWASARTCAASSSATRMIFSIRAPKPSTGETCSAGGAVVAGLQVQLLDPGLQLLHPLRQPVALAQGAGELRLERGEVRVDLVAVVTAQCTSNGTDCDASGMNGLPPGKHERRLDLGILAGGHNRHQDTE